MVILSNHVGYESKSLISKQVDVTAGKDYTNPKNIVGNKKQPSKFSCVCHKKINKNLKSKAKLTGKVKYIPESELAKLNPFLRSVAGQSILNLSALNNKIKVYFATNSNQDTTNLNNWLGIYEEGFKTLSLGWDKSGKDLNEAALLLHANYLGINIEIVSTYAAADFVSFLALELPEDAYGIATFPKDIDEFPQVNGKLCIAISAVVMYGEFPIPLERGSIFYWTLIHEIGHTYGLAHPHDNGNGTSIMPGCSDIFSSSLFNQGLFYENNLLTTIMSYVSPAAQFYIENGEKVWNSNVSRTLMELDLQSYRFLYNATNNQLYIDKWLDLSCNIYVVQTLISTLNGITLNLVPTLDINLYFNLSLDKYSANPIQDVSNGYSVISSSLVGYLQFPTCTEESPSTFSASLLDKDSYIKQVNNSYIILNVFAKTISNNCLIKNVLDDSQEINIWLKCRSSDYIVTQSPTLTLIQNKINSNILTIENNADSTVTVNFGNNEPLSKKIKGKK